MATLPSLKFVLHQDTGYLYVTRNGGTKARPSGYTRSVHGWGAEIHLLGLIRRRLAEAGIYVIKKAAQKDQLFAHMWGDENTPYLRTRHDERLTQPNIYIYDPDYAIRSSAEQYNNGEEVCFTVQGDIFQKEGQPPLQPDWNQRVLQLCQQGGIPCELKVSEPPMVIPSLESVKTQEEARALAVQWQHWQAEQDLSWEEVLRWQEFFGALAEKFDLTEEFHENGIA